MAREYLKKAREEMGLSIEEAGNRLGMSDIAYEAFENGGFIKDINLSLVQKIGEAFGISAIYVAEEEMKEL